MDAKEIAEEIRLGEFWLAANDMGETLRLIDRVPVKRTRRDYHLDLIGIVASYCRPFKTNNRKRVVGREVLATLSDADRKLHDRVSEIRDQDRAHSDLYEGRVSLGPKGKGIRVRTIKTPEGDALRVILSICWDFRHRTITRRELRRLRGMARKMRNQFETASQEALLAVIVRRAKMGSAKWFALGVDGDAKVPPIGRRIRGVW